MVMNFRYERKLRCGCEVIFVDNNPTSAPWNALSFFRVQIFRSDKSKPAQEEVKPAGIQECGVTFVHWIPAFAGKTTLLISVGQVDSPYKSTDYLGTFATHHHSIDTRASVMYFDS